MPAKAGYKRYVVVISFEGVTKSLFLQVGLHRKVPAINSFGRNDFE